MREVGTAALLDQHPLWGGALERLLASAGIRVVANVADPDHLIEVLADQAPDVLIVDVEVDDPERGLEAIRRTRDLYPDARIVAFAHTADDEKIDAAFTAGACVFCVKTADPADLVAAVRQALRSSIYVARANPRTSVGGSAGATAPATTARLTKRELEILRLVSEGNSNAYVAKALWVTEQTIKFHMSNIYRKLGVANRTEASRWAQLNGVLPPTREVEPAAVP